MSDNKGLMAGKRGLIMGVANDRSLGWGIAKAVADQGAELAFTFQGEALEKRVRPLAATLGVKHVLPADVTVNFHMCRGNFGKLASGSYDHIAEKLFNGLNVDGYLLEYDDERSGGFEPLRQVPEDRSVVLGLVSAKRPVLESKAELKSRIEAASAFVRLERLALSCENRAVPA